MNKKTKLGIFIGILAAVVSAAILIVVFWDRLVELCPFCRRSDWDDDFLMDEDEEDVPAFTEVERNDFADLDAE
ncbi:MAG: hypothetical protein IJO88_05830 [Oscillospiraceae bacterium]|nr:hypothetical protein [Oscillospiraceae bacterium]